MYRYKYALPPEIFDTHPLQILQLVCKDRGEIIMVSRVMEMHEEKEKNSGAWLAANRRAKIWARAVGRFHVKNRSDRRHRSRSSTSLSPRDHCC